jgi:superfamily II DNA/RNA helicase
MLDMGFSDDILFIAKQLSKNHQTIMFSATMPQKIQQLANTLLYNPVEVKIAVSKPAEKIQQSAYLCYEPQKLGLIRALFKAGELERVIIFSGKKEKVKDIYHELKHMNINCAAMHSDLSQAERDDVMFRFKSGQVSVLVATDIVARGIDIDDIFCVINYDVPHDAEDYVHRIGRTARAQRDGVAITLISDQDMRYFADIERFLDSNIQKNPLPDNLGEGPQYNPSTPRKLSCGRGGRKRASNGKPRQHGGGKHNKSQPAANINSQQSKSRSKRKRHGRKTEKSNREQGKAIRS